MLVSPASRLYMSAMGSQESEVQLVLITYYVLIVGFFFFFFLLANNLIFLNCCMFLFFLNLNLFILIGG